MSDIDFAELDKAVSNLVNKNNPDSSDIISTKTQSQQNQPSQNVEQKRKGRFMDVVHHSSDMIGKVDNQPKQAEPTATTHRKVVNPIYSDVMQPVNNMPAPPAAHESPAGDQPNPSSDWPDPIEALETSEVDSLADVDHVKNNKPDGLFLTDTKVEKRPLGGFNDQTPLDSSQKIAVEPEETQPPPPNNVLTSSGSQEVDLPPELEADLVAIEEGSQSTKKTAPELEFEPINESPTETDDQLDSESELNRPSKPEPQPSKPEKHEVTGLLAAGSIPQQYKTSNPPETVTAPAHPIFFDADQYDKSPAAAASQPKSSSTSFFQWVFIIVGLLLLGATLGTALFVFVSTK